jgi:hypothetical protein
MPITSTATIYNRHTGATETLPADQAALKTFYQRDEWSSTKPPPLNWAFEVPRYRIVRDLKPAEKNRFRFENPFSETSSNDSWQFGDRHYEAGEEIESTCWPHPSMRALNYSAERVLAFFNSEMKSRLTVSPWHGGQVVLDNGLSNMPGIVNIKPRLPQPMNLRP